MSIEGRAAIITGGGTGVGRATALGLARLGVSVAVNYSRSADEAAATARDCEAEGVEAVALQADVASNASVVAMVEQAAAALGRVDYLVNSAGTTVFVDHPDLDALTEAAWQRVMGVNLVGAFYATRACAPHMRTAGAGAVVNVSSVAGITGAGSSIPYAASKGALNTMTRSLARALAPEVRVNAVAPGIIDTRWVDDRREFLDAAVEKTPLRRAAVAEDIAESVIHLLQSTFTTGEVLVIDGGISL